MYTIVTPAIAAMKYCPRLRCTHVRTPPRPSRACMHIQSHATPRCMDIDIDIAACARRHRKQLSTLAGINQSSRHHEQLSPRAHAKSTVAGTSETQFLQPRDGEDPTRAHRLKRRSFSVRSVRCPAAGVDPHSHSRHVQAAARRMADTCA